MCYITCCLTLDKTFLQHLTSCDLNQRDNNTRNIPVKGLAPLCFSLKQTSYYFNTNCIPWGIDHDTFNQEKFIYFHYDIRMNKKRLITLCKKWFTFVVDWVQLAMVQLCFKYLWWALYKIALILKDGEFQMLLYLFSIIIWIKRVQLETENFQNKSTTSHSQWKNNIVI